MSDRDDPGAAVAGEDFLYHLYRGTELLQDNRVHAAKAELEQALSVQPSDPKGQDLLGIVYFRLGLYPRAIAIYERLIQAHPDAVEPRINLALSYLKTGQPALAQKELERALEQNPQHQRAWGYLGLAFQRMGQYERASQAFAAGGHEAMARRLLEMAGGAGPRGEGPEAPGERSEAHDESPAPIEAGTADAEAKPATTAVAAEPTPEATLAAGETQVAATIEDAASHVAAEAVQTLDRPDAGFQRDSELPRIPSGKWAAIEPGREPLPEVRPPAQEITPGTYLAGEVRRPSTLFAAIHDGARRVDAAPLTAQAGEAPPSRRSSPPSSSAMPSFKARPPATPLGFARERLLVFPRDLPVSQHASGLVLVQAARGFATRLSGIHAITAALAIPARALQRHTRGRTMEEPLGGPEAPIYELGARCELVLAPPEGRRLQALVISDEPLYLREDVLFGFDLAVSYENGRLPLGDGEATAMVQLRGRGSVVAALPEQASAIEIVTGRTTAVRAAAVLGWLGRLIPRALQPSEAFQTPSVEGARGAGRRRRPEAPSVEGLVAFAGEGMVMVDGS